MEKKTDFDSINTKKSNQFKNLFRLSLNNIENRLNAHTTTLALPMRELKSTEYLFKLCSGIAWQW